MLSKINKCHLSWREEVMKDSATKWMQRATVRVRKIMLQSMLIRSTTSMPAKLATLAIQKNSPLIMTDDMPDFSIQMKAKDTKELQPARRITIRKMRILRSCSAVMYLEHWMRMPATKPKRFSRLMTLVVEMWNLFLMKVPRLLKMAVDRLAASPIKAMSFSVSPCPSKMMPKSDPQVQFMPTILPQLTMMISVCLLFLMKGMTCLMRLVLSCELAKEEEDSLVGVLFSSTICFFNLKRRQIVTIVASVPKAAMIPLRWLMRPWVQVSESVGPSCPALMQVIPQRMQKLIPRTGRNSGTEAAQPFCQSGNSFSSPQGAVMMGMWATATMMVIKRAMWQLSPARYLPTAPSPVAKVENSTKGKQCLLKARKRMGLTMMQKMLKELENSRIMVLFWPQNSSASGRMAKKVPTIMSMVTETEVTERMSPHSSSIILFEKLWTNSPPSSPRKSPTASCSPWTTSPTLSSSLSSRTTF